MGRRRVTLAVVDELHLVGGLVRTRTVFFDPTPLWRAGLVQPLLWPRLLREVWRLWRRERSRSSTPELASPAAGG
jgi:hypothetical protein